MVHGLEGRWTVETTKGFVMKRLEVTRSGRGKFKVRFDISKAEFSALDLKSLQLPDLKTDGLTEKAALEAAGKLESALERLSPISSKKAGKRG